MTDRERDKLGEECASEPHESLLRGFLHNVTGLPYEPLRTLEEAQAANDGAVVLEGDWGGQIYVVAGPAVTRCGEPALRQLLLDIDERAWPVNDGDGAAVCFERATVGTGVAGGMGGGRVTEDVWVHPELVQSGDEPGIACRASRTCATPTHRESRHRPPRPGADPPRLPRASPSERHPLRPRVAGELEHGAPRGAPAARGR